MSRRKKKELKVVIRFSPEVDFKKDFDSFVLQILSSKKKRRKVKAKPVKIY